MGLKQNSISELRKELAESNKVINISKGAKGKLKNLLNRFSKEDHDLIKETNDTPESNGIAIFGGSGSAEKRNHLNQPVSDGVNEHSKEGLRRDSAHEINTKKLERENDLKNLLKS